MEVINKKFIELKASEGKIFKCGDEFVGEGLCFMIGENEDIQEYISKYTEVDYEEYEKFLEEAEAQALLEEAQAQNL